MLMFFDFSFKKFLNNGFIHINSDSLIVPSKIHLFKWFDLFKYIQSLNGLSKIHLSNGFAPYFSPCSLLIVAVPNLSLMVHQSILNTSPV